MNTPTKQNNKSIMKDLPSSLKQINPLKDNSKRLKTKIENEAPKTVRTT